MCEGSLLSGLLSAMPWFSSNAASNLKLNRLSPREPGLMGEAGLITGDLRLVRFSYIYIGFRVEG